MAIIVYLLCAMMSTVCVGLLLRSYTRTKSGLLLLCSLCFVGLAINNIFLFVDLVIIPANDLSLVRSTAALFGLSLLLIGLIWETV